MSAEVLLQCIFAVMASLGYHDYADYEDHGTPTTRMNVTVAVSAPLPLIYSW
jgi:hypothetical protein